MDKMKDSGKLNIWKIDGQMDYWKVGWCKWTWMGCSICKYEEWIDGWMDGRDE